MSWSFWNNFLNSDKDTISFEELEEDKDAKKWADEHQAEAKLIDELMDNPELLKEYEEKYGKI